MKVKVTIVNEQGEVTDVATAFIGEASIESLLNNKLLFCEVDGCKAYVAEPLSIENSDLDICCPECARK